MDEETMSRAFDPFFTTKQLGEGTGLGLATVHGIVTQGGGDMQITSAVGEGTTFDIYLPAAEAAHEPASKRSMQASPGREVVLVVEDMEVVRSLVRKILERNGYEVITAGGGAEALESVRTLARPVDLLLTDMVMPGMNGRDLSKELQALYPEVARDLYVRIHARPGAPPRGRNRTGGFPAEAVLREYADRDRPRGPRPPHGRRRRNTVGSLNGDLRSLERAYFGQWIDERSSPAQLRLLLLHARSLSSAVASKSPW